MKCRAHFITDKAITGRFVHCVCVCVFVHRKRKLLARQVRLWRNFPCLAGLSVAFCQQMSQPNEMNERQRAARDHHSRFVRAPVFSLCVSLSVNLWFNVFVCAWCNNKMRYKHTFILKLQSAVYFIRYYCHCAMHHTVHSIHYNCFISLPLSFSRALTRSPPLRLSVNERALFPFTHPEACCFNKSTFIFIGCCCAYYLVCSDFFRSFVVCLPFDSLWMLFAIFLLRRFGDMKIIQPYGLLYWWRVHWIFGAFGISKLCLSTFRPWRRRRRWYRWCRQQYFS